MDYLIGTDIGTSGTKTILMDTAGNLISQDLQVYDVLIPKPLWAEQWPDVWVDATKKSILNTVKKSGIAPENVKGICISGLYGGSGIPLDSSMKPVRPCLIWMDRRAEEQEKWVREKIGVEKLKRITHNGADPYYGYLKMLWIRDNEPENWQKIKLFLPPNAYAIYELTGEVAIDYSSAGNIGGIFDMNTRTWSYQLMEKMGIPRDMMPARLVESSDIVGRLSAKSAGELGLAEGIPVCAGGVDCGVATFGLGVFEPGEYAATIGTSMCAALIHSEPVETEGLIEWPYVYKSKELAYSFGGGATAGAVIKWFRDTFAELEKSEEQQGGADAYFALDKQVEEIECGSDGLIVLPYFMGERSPIWDTNAKGVIFGLSLMHTKAHIYRAFLEAVAYSLRQSMEAAGTDLGESILLAGGVSKSRLWKQIFADVTGHSVVCPIHDVEANLGDVMLAGLGTGTINIEQLKTWRVLDEKIEPNTEAHTKYNEYYKLYREIYISLKMDMKQISLINNKFSISEK
jgi:xylulokinase